MIAPARRVYQRIEVNRLGEVYHWLILRSGICTQIEIYINIYILYNIIYIILYILYYTLYILYMYIYR